MGSGDAAVRGRIEAVVHGRVQGVGYRAWVVTEARRLGLAGHARNLPDRRQVEVVAEGATAALDRLLVAMRRGPVFARVERVDANRFPARGDLDRFDVRA